MWNAFADASAAPTPPSPSGRTRDSLDDGADPNELILTLLPWLISLLLHVGLVLLAIFVVWSVRVELDEEEVIIPIARLSQTPGTPLQVTRTQTQTQSQASRSRSLSRSRSTSQSQSTMATATSTESMSIGAAGGAAGSANPFGGGVGAGSELQATFFGTGGNARKLAYLVDASGSLIDTLPFVILELKRSISELSERQSFTVIFFQGSEAIETPPAGMRRANAENKARVIRWISLENGNITPMGGSTPVPALTLALRRQPDLIFLLSDNITGQGRYEVDQRRLLRDIHEANRANTKINTIQYIYPDPLTRVGMTATMELIASQTGGIYKFLDARELGIR